MGGPHVLKGHVNQRGRFANFHLQTIILQNTCQHFAKESLERYPYPLSLSQSDFPQTVPQAGSISHRPGQSIKRPIFWAMVNNPSPEQVVQRSIIVRLEMTSVNLIQLSQGHQRLMEELVIPG